MGIVVTNYGGPLSYSDMISEGDKKKYTIDFRPWQEDNETITSVEWTGAVEDQTLVDGVASGVISDCGVYTVKAITANLSKVVTLKIGEMRNEEDY